MIRVIYLVIVFLIIGCEESNSNFNSQQQTEVNNSWYKPDVSTTWYWQLQGEVNISHNVQVYDIDLFDTNLTTIRQLHQQGKKVICYFSAGSYEDWREDKEKFPNELLGNIHGVKAKRRPKPKNVKSVIKKFPLSKFWIIESVSEIELI